MLTQFYLNRFVSVIFIWIFQFLTLRHYEETLRIKLINKLCTNLGKNYTLWYRDTGFVKNLPPFSISKMGRNFEKRRNMYSVNSRGTAFSL